MASARPTTGISRTRDCPRPVDASKDAHTRGRSAEPPSDLAKRAQVARQQSLRASQKEHVDEILLDAQRREPTVGARRHARIADDAPGTVALREHRRDVVAVTDDEESRG